MKTMLQLSLGLSLGLAASEAAAQTATSSVTAEDMKAIEAAFAAEPQDMGALSTPVPTVSSAGGAAAALAAIFQDMNPNMAVILDVAGSYFSQEPQQLGAHDPNRTGFTFQQLELSITANVDPFFAFTSNIVFAQFGVEVEEAYASTLRLPAGLQLRAGQFLTRFGRLNATHPHSWSFVDQPLVNGKFFGGEGSRGLGAEISALLPLPWYAELVASGTDAAGECCARTFFAGNDLGVKDPRDILWTTAVKQFFPFDDDWSLFWGFSGQFGPNSTGRRNRSEIYGTDLYLRYRPVDSEQRSAVSLQVEGLYRARQVPGDSLRDYGLYAQLLWNFHLQWETGARFEYVSGTANDYLDPEWTAARQRTSLQLTHYPSHFSRIRLQGNWDRPPGEEATIWGLMLGLEVLVGEHGAHNF